MACASPLSGRADAAASAGAPCAAAGGAFAGGGGLRAGGASRLCAGLCPCAAVADRCAHEAPLVRAGRGGGGDRDHGAHFAGLHAARLPQPQGAAAAAGAGARPAGGAARGVVVGAADRGCLRAGERQGAIGAPVCQPAGSQQAGRDVDDHGCRDVGCRRWPDGRQRALDAARCLLRAAHPHADRRCAGRARDRRSGADCGLHARAAQAGGAERGAAGAELRGAGAVAPDPLPAGTGLCGACAS